jgi:hypothetical protein
MANHKDHQTPRVTLADTVDALNRMRDLLVELSLALQDYQFHLEPKTGSAVARRAAQCIDHARSGPTPGCQL